MKNGSITTEDISDLISNCETSLHGEIVEENLPSKYDLQRGTALIFCTDNLEKVCSDSRDLLRNSMGKIMMD